MNPHFTALEAAYQLHYYLWFKTHYLLASARQYVESQTNHHGYKGEWTQPMKYRNEAFKSPAFCFDHCATILNYHFVFATQNRIAVFDETIAPGFFEYIVSVGKKHSFEIDRIGLLPDHMHMTIEGVPTISVEEYALAILNNTRHWMEKNYISVLKNTAHGTCGSHRFTLGRLVNTPQRR